MGEKRHRRNFPAKELKSLSFAVLVGVVAGVALLSSGLLDVRSESLSSSDRVQPSRPGLTDHENAPEGAVLFSSDPRARHDATLIDSIAPNLSATMVIGTSPPNFQSSRSIKEAAFAAETLDPNWRHQKFQELSASLAVIAHSTESAQIDCKSSMCRVELVSRNTEDPEEKNNRLKAWFEEVKQAGFQRMDSEFLPDGTTSLSYLFSKPLSLRAQLPLELDPELAESFEEALRTNEVDQPTGPGQTFDPITWVGATPIDPA